jgi:transposase
VVSCYEAGYDGFWLHRRLEAAGITNFVFDPASIAVEQRARRAKTDRIDGELLLRTLMAYCRGEPRVVRIVRVPTPEQEDARRATRERERLIKEQTAHTNRIKACCASQEWRRAIRAGATGWLGSSGSATGMASRCSLTKWLNSSASTPG